MTVAGDADTIESILVATDGSDAALGALDRALTIADGLEAAVHVLAVVDPDGSPLVFDLGTVHDLETAKERLVDEIVEQYDDHTVEVKGVVRRGRPADQIVGYARESGADLVVIGRSGQTGVAEALLGSTTDRVLRKSPAPVVVVPAPDAD